MRTTQTAGPGGTTTQSRQAPCHCPEEMPPKECCCNLVCFDRPNYFCGHLLTDADLTLQQRYVVEKNKLYHRTLDGFGVVCGLKLTCDCDCKGNILVHDGFAIDDCGNDLVVCETLRFDVIARLKSKNLLVVDPEEGESRCDIKQCFYVTICYDETESQFETPFQSSCTAGPKQCLPTRIYEGVRFDVTDKPPTRHSYLESLEKRIRECFELNCDSPVGVILKKHAPELLAMFEDNEQQREPQHDPCELFCTLRAYFLNHLKVKPDRFNCNLHEEVARLRCPGERRDEQRWRDEEYRDEMRKAFAELLFHMQRYQYDCVYGDLVFECSQPCEAHCLVLGTVEVLNGKLVRVCNTPRQYLWAPANLLQVLLFEIMTGRAATQEETVPGEEQRAHCCPQYPRFEPVEFLKEFSVSECGRRYAAESAIESFRDVAQSLHRSFDFTDSGAFAPRLFAELLDRTEEERIAGLHTMGVSASLSKVKAAELGASNPMQALAERSLLRRGDSVLGYRSAQGVRVLPDFVKQISPDRSLGGDLESLLATQTREMSEMRTQIEALKKKLDDLDDPQKSPKKRGG
jgi:hypothetical protein